MLDPNTQAHPRPLRHFPLMPRPRARPPGRPEKLLAQAIGVLARGRVDLLDRKALGDSAVRDFRIVEGLE